MSFFNSKRSLYFDAYIFKLYNINCQRTVIRSLVKICIYWWLYYVFRYKEGNFLARRKSTLKVHTQKWAARRDCLQMYRYVFHQWLQCRYMAVTATSIHCSRIHIDPTLVLIPFYTYINIAQSRLSFSSSRDWMS